MSELLKTVDNEHQILSCSELQVVETPSEMWLFIMSYWLTDIFQHLSSSVQYAAESNECKRVLICVFISQADKLKDQCVWGPSVFGLTTVRNIRNSSVSVVMACNGQEEEFEREPAQPVQCFTVISSFRVLLTLLNIIRTQTQGRERSEAFVQSFTLQVRASHLRRAEQWTPKRAAETLTASYKRSKSLLYLCICSYMPVWMCACELELLS